MYASVKWINEYLDRPASADEMASLLIEHAFPLEGREKIEGGDERLDVELTSNRGDCLCHVGLAREVAAASARALRPPQPAPRASGPDTGSVAKVFNREPRLCPLYTARIIRGVAIKPSPAWLADRLRAIGQNPRNNIVDASNFVLFELGQPTHVFDLATLRGKQIIVRKASRDEPFLPIGEGEKEIKLGEQDLVIADAERAVAIAGVKGGALTAVTSSTKEILIEAATFQPAAVRAASRRHGIASDSSYRFERGVHPGQIERAAMRLAELILDLAGGELCDGVVSDGAPIPPPRVVLLRPRRCREILGIDIDDHRMMDWLQRLGFRVTRKLDVLECLVPVERLDIEREIDLIEEISRMHGYDGMSVRDRIEVRVAPPQAVEQARRAIQSTLVGIGYVETVTHSLIGEQVSAAFLPPGMSSLRVADERARAEPVLRPSIIPSLLRVYAFNRDRGARDVRLFETAATFASIDGQHAERVNLALLEPVDGSPADLRRTRGAIDRLIAVVLGHECAVEIEPIDGFSWLDPGAAIRVNGEVLGTLGLLSANALALSGVDEPLCAAEIGLPALYDRYPPATSARALPQFPPVDRDISIVVDETVQWRHIAAAVAALDEPALESLEFVTTFRGRQIPPGRKSVTMRLRFRAPDRTLTSEEVDAAMKSIIQALQSHLRGEIRA
jgi:phenylalanyl-tRNA synthetase beta chain